MRQHIIMIPLKAKSHPINEQSVKWSDCKNNHFAPYGCCAAGEGCARWLFSSVWLFSGWSVSAFLAPLFKQHFCLSQLMFMYESLTLTTEGFDDGVVCAREPQGQRCRVDRVCARGTRNEALPWCLSCFRLARLSRLPVSWHFTTDQFSYSDKMKRSLIDGEMARMVCMVCYNGL